MQLELMNIDSVVSWANSLLSTFLKLSSADILITLFGKCVCHGSLLVINKLYLCINERTC